MSCGVSGCKYHPKLFGVCGRHKKFYWTSKDPKFQKDMKDYDKLFSTYIQETKDLEERGFNVLEIQGCWDSNLCGERRHAFPLHLKTVGELFESLLSFVQGMQRKYDPVLVYNVTTRINHKYGPPCGCSYCSIGQQKLV